MAISKVVFGNETLMDITSSLVNEDNLLVGGVAFDSAGERVDGKCTFDADTSLGTAEASEILLDRKAYVKGVEVIGTMPIRTEDSATISTRDETVAIQSGYHDGSGVVGISESAKLTITANNIRSGINILGIEGTYSGESGGEAQSKEATPTREEQVIVPDYDEGYDYLTQVTVHAIPYRTETNGRGLTAYIAQPTV